MNICVLHIGGKTFPLGV